MTVDFKWALQFVEKWYEKLKIQERNASYKFKSNFVVIRRSIQHSTGTVL